MKPGIRPGTEKRCEMLRLFNEKCISLNQQYQYVQQMHGKSEEEKEQIAEKIIRQIKNIYNTETNHGDDS